MKTTEEMNLKRRGQKLALDLSEFQEFALVQQTLGHIYSFLESTSQKCFANTWAKETLK